jgi:hypothetical protein
MQVQMRHFSVEQQQKLSLWNLLNDIPFRMNWEDSLSAKIQQAYRHLVVEENYSYLKSNLQNV